MLSAAAVAFYGCTPAGPRGDAQPELHEELCREQQQTDLQARVWSDRSGVGRPRLFEQVFTLVFGREGAGQRD